LTCKDYGVFLIKIIKIDLILFLEKGEPGERAFGGDLQKG
jgi:hypothetical protein